MTSNKLINVEEEDKEREKKLNIISWLVNSCREQK
jgi:hypothetical protein